MAQEGKPALADLVRQGETQAEADRIEDFIFGVRDISNAYLVTTSAGDVMINTGFMDNAARNKALLEPHRTGPLRYILLTQSHADHFGGVPVFAEDATEVIGGPGFVDNWRDMHRLQPFFGPRTRKLWGSTLKRGSAPMPPPEVHPDLEIADSYEFTLGGRVFQLLHTPEGETTDGLTVWLPNERVAFTGNLVGPVWLSVPNLNTVRGDRPRRVRSYLSSLERLRALEPELVVTGHGEPIRGAAKIRADIDRMLGAMRHVRDAVLEGMIAGKDMHTLMREITLPEDLSLGQFHGKVSWAVKAIWHEYVGWFHYRSTTELYGIPRIAVHGDLAELAGTDALVARATDHVANGAPLKAIHLLDIALDAEPGHEKGLQTKQAALEILLRESAGANLSETMWLKSEIAECENRLGGSA